MAEPIQALMVSASGHTWITSLSCAVHAVYVPKYKRSLPKFWGGGTTGIDDKLLHVMRVFTLLRPYSNRGIQVYEEETV